MRPTSFISKSASLVPNYASKDFNPEYQKIKSIKASEFPLYIKESLDKEMTDLLLDYLKGEI